MFTLTLPIDGVRAYAHTEWYMYMYMYMYLVPTCIHAI